ncbi:MAG: ferric reductase-like transmembrane domain-containing protein [Stappiaceae bacterium]
MLSIIFDKLRRIINAPLTLWLVLAWPSLPVLWDFYENNRYFAEMMSNTGVLSIQLMVLTLSITPLMLLFKHWEIGKQVMRWFLKRRRYFGIASFGYAALHLLIYIRDIGDFTNIYLEAFDIAFTVGWLGFLLMVPAALASNDFSIRKLGTSWKTLQRLIYPAIILIFVHWLYFEIFWDDALMWMSALALIKSYHLIYRLVQRRSLAFRTRRAAT